MSETKGWLGWMTEDCVAGRCAGADLGLDDPCGVKYEPKGAHTVPVWITRMGDAGEPKTGDRMMWATREVEVVSPVFEGGHWIAVARIPGKELAIAAVADLSPIPSTRTVTVELTQEEVEQIGKLASVTLSLAEKKLLAALEDS